MNLPGTKEKAVYEKLAAMTTVVVSMLFGIVHAEVDVLTPAFRATIRRCGAGQSRKNQ